MPSSTVTAGEIYPFFANHVFLKYLDNQKGQKQAYWIFFNLFLRQTF